MVITGLIDSIEPSIASAPPMRPPLRRYWSVSSVAGERDPPATLFELGEDRVDVGAFLGAPRHEEHEVALRHRNGLRVEDLRRADHFERLAATCAVASSPT